jgi:hypothetical protein
MAKRKSEQAGQAIGLIVGLVMVAALLAAAVLPLFLLFRYLQHRYLAYRLRKDYDLAENGWWISEEERNIFKESSAQEKARLSRNKREHASLQNLLDEQHKKAAEAGLPTTNWGKYSRHSNLGKEIQGKIDELESYMQELDLNEYEVSCRQPIEFWNELNDILKKQDIAFVALLAWACGAFFFYSAYQQGAPFGIWLDLLVPALCAGFGAGLAALFSRNPAVRYMPKPLEITLDNVDNPRFSLPQRSRFFLKFAGICVWLGVMVFASQEGRRYGAIQKVSHQAQIKKQNDIADESERRAQELWDLGHTSPDGTLVDSEGRVTDKYSRPDSNVPNIMLYLNTAHFSPIPSLTLSKLNSGEVEEFILAIYARHGAVFESASAQEWAEQQPWYKKVPGKTILEAERDFDTAAQNNVRALVNRWNEIQVEEGHAPLPVEESPLAGRGDGSEIEEGDVNASVAVLKALPVSEGSAINQGNLNADEVGQWSAARVRYEINTIYARHGVVFPKREIQAYFESKDWYQAVPGRTFDEVEQLFSPAEKIDIEVLAARREELSKKE